MIVSLSVPVSFSRSSYCKVITGIGNSSHLLLANLTSKMLNFRFNAFVSEVFETSCRIYFQEKEQALINEKSSLPSNQEAARE
jgi:hypothetical protein